MRIPRIKKIKNRTDAAFFDFKILIADVINQRRNIGTARLFVAGDDKRQPLLGAGNRHVQKVGVVGKLTGNIIRR